MDFLILLLILLFSGIGYFIFSSYFIQSNIRKFNIKNSLIDDFKKKVLGKYFGSAYFGVSHRIVPKSEYNSFSNREKIHFSKCYNVITFKTPDANWELFFHLVKEGMVFSEIMTLRVFPKSIKIRSEGNVEKNFGKLNIFTNNKYLTNILEEEKIYNELNNILKKNEDILVISHNCIYLKTFFDSKDYNMKALLSLVKSMHVVKNKVFREGVMEY